VIVVPAIAGGDYLAGEGSTMIRITFDELFERLRAVLLKAGLEEERAELCARLFAETSLDGVYSHGLNRFPRFMRYIEKGYVDLRARPERTDAFGVWERWDGKLGPGNLNAHACMGRAVELAREGGMGCVALRDTNHWMRGGSYGIQAAESGCIGIAWTNTLPNLPSWGAKTCNVGNNPLVLAVPKESGHVLLDMAMSQFSYGKMEAAAAKGENLPVEGGFDKEGKLSRDPAAILESGRPLPIGYWKGSGLSLLLDLAAALLSGGSSTARIGELEAEYGLSQVFIAFDLRKLPDPDSTRRAVEEAIDAFHRASPDREGGRVYYPGERMRLTREENLVKGIPVDERVWEEVGHML
jgi:3-dehydro-L-gulonate 2-dehydrogenase